MYGWNSCWRNVFGRNATCLWFLHSHNMWLFPLLISTLIIPDRWEHWRLWLTEKPFLFCLSNSSKTNTHINKKNNQEKLTKSWKLGQTKIFYCVKRKIYPISMNSSLLWLWWALQIIHLENQSSDISSVICHFDRLCFQGHIGKEL